MTITVSALLWAFLSAPLFAEQTQFTAFTIPSKDLTLAFVQTGRLVKINVKPGDTVHSSQELAKLDDSVQQVRLEELKLKAEDTTEIQAKEAELEQKRVDLQKFEKAAQTEAVTELEIQHARLDVRIAEMGLKLTRLQHKIAQKQYEQALVETQQMTLNSPAEGIVEKVFFETGEAVKPLDDVIHVVQINPLWADVPVIPIAAATPLSTGSSATVTFPDGSTAQAKVIFVSPVADSSSRTLNVRIQIPNEQKRPAGETITVSF